MSDMDRGWDDIAPSVDADAIRTAFPHVMGFPEHIKGTRHERCHSCDAWVQGETEAGPRGAMKWHLSEAHAVCFCGQPNESHPPGPPCPPPPPPGGTQG